MKKICVQFRQDAEGTFLKMSRWENDRIEPAVSIHKLIARVVLRCRVERANEPSERSEPASERANATFKCPLCGIAAVVVKRGSLNKITMW